MPAPPEDVIGSVMRASARSAAVVHAEMSNGVNGLATVAAIAPWLGLFGTLISITHSFAGCGGDRATCMAAVIELLAVSVWPTAIGLAVGVVSLWFYRYSASTLNGFDIEMESATLELVNQLTRYAGPWTFPAAAVAVADRPSSPSVFRRDIHLPPPLARMIKRWGFRRLLPAMQLLFCGGLAVAESFYWMATSGESQWLEYLPSTSLFAEAVNAPADSVARHALLLFGHSQPGHAALIAIVLPVGAVLWYLAGAWLDRRSQARCSRHSHRPLQWAFVLLAAALWLSTIPDLLLSFFSVSLWMTASAVSRSLWALFFFYTQLHSLDAGPDSVVAMRLSGR